MMWLWILIPVVLIVMLYFYKGGKGLNSPKRENPMDILDKRFAKGEISKEEYEEQKQSLNSKS